MSSAETDTETKAVPPDGRSRADRATDRYHGSFRRQLRVVAIGLLVVNLALGLFARHQQHAIIDYAINILRHRLHLHQLCHLAQISFQHYVDERSRAAGPAEISKANELLENVLDEMDVAIERSTSPRSHDWALEIKANIAALLESRSRRSRTGGTDLGRSSRRWRGCSARNTDVGLQRARRHRGVFLQGRSLAAGIDRHQHHAGGTGADPDPPHDQFVEAAIECAALRGARGHAAGT